MIAGCEIGENTCVVDGANAPKEGVSGGFAAISG